MPRKQAKPAHPRQTGPVIILDMKDAKVLKQGPSGVGDHLGKASKEPQCVERPVTGGFKLGGDHGVSAVDF